MDSVTPAAARVLRAAVPLTDDPDARNIFLVLAYRGDPATNLGFVRAHADTTPGYGPIALRYIEGDPEQFSDSWGMDLASREYVSRWAGRSFPGFLAPLDSITGWRPSYWEPERKREWARAHQPSAVSLLVRRLASTQEPKSVTALAFLLLDLGDTTGVPQLRQLIRTLTAEQQPYIPSEYRELLAEPVTGAMLVSVQSQLVAYALGKTLIAPDGKALTPFGPHDERPDQHFILREDLDSVVVQNVIREGRLTPITEKELQVTAERDTIAMALYLRPPQRFGPVIEATIALSPRTRGGVMCLCGGVAIFRFVVTPAGPVPVGVAMLIS
jgi:hypothetical protein